MFLTLLYVHKINNSKSYRTREVLHGRGVENIRFTVILGDIVKEIQIMLEDLNRKE